MPVPYSVFRRAVSGHIVFLVFPVFRRILFRR